MAKRKHIPDSTIAEVLIESRRHCCLCFHFGGALEKCDGQIAHIDRDPSNSNLDNLVWLCLKHHEEYDRMPSAAKRMTEGEVKRALEELHQYLGSLPMYSHAVGSNEALIFFEVTLPGDLNDFTEAEQAEILRALGKLARIRDGVQLMYKRRGSIKLGIGVTEEEAKRLIAAFTNGALRGLGISEIGFWTVDTSTILAAVNEKVLKVVELGGDVSESYLRKLTYSALIDEIRKARRKKGYVEDVDDDKPDIDLPEPAAEARVSVIRDCLGQIAIPRRNAVILHLQGNSIPEIARLMGWDEKKADNLVYRGMSDLRACLKKKGIGS